jgi:hypothetical protein
MPGTISGMSITLTYAGTTLDLGDRLVWSDEYSWHPVKQSTSPSTTGALLVDVGVLQAGRPITQEGAQSNAWITRATCDTLKAWAAIPAAEMVLVLRGTPHTVIFDHERTGFEAQALWRLADGEHTAQEVFLPTLRFLEV